MKKRFHVIPAIDVRGGKAVRMVEGKASTEKVVGEDPVAIARDWVARGAKSLHVVDLDAAFGKGHNRDLLAKLIRAAKVPVHVGGGIRSDEAVESCLAMKAARLVCGTRAITDPGWISWAANRWPDRLIIGADARGLDLVVRGWTAKAGKNVLEYLKIVEALPLAAILYTNVDVEGKTAGVDWSPVKEVVKATRHAVLVSGGITSVDDVRKARASGAAGVVIGSALYFGKLSFEEALGA